ncbi:hypothetical protein GCM10028789_31000 [Sinomonas halotolerans]
MHDVPYNGEPALVEPVEGAAEVLAALRAEGVALGVITNQSGIGRGLITRAQADAVNARIEELLGPFDVWCVCPHAPEDGCGCRKPAPGMVLAACEALGAAPEATVMVGDIGADMEAARRAGARGILVPTPVTRREEVLAAPEQADDLAGALHLILGRAQTPAGVTAAEAAQ